jgi:hypothetical protein
MEIRFHIDPDTAEPHIAGHGIATWEAIDVLLRQDMDYNGREGTRVAIGQTRNGRYLKVIYRRYEADGSRLIITAYELKRKAKAALRRARRRRK